MKQALEKLAGSFEAFAEELRGMAYDQPKAAGGGEYAFDGQEDYEDNVVPLAQNRADDIEDEKVITMKSGELRKVIDAYRKLVRFAREGRIPTQDERFKLHQSVRAVKHLIRPPRR